MNEEIKKMKAMNMRYRHSIFEGLNYNEIMSNIEEIQEECSGVQYYVNDDETLLNAMDGDEDQAYEFKMAYCEIEAEAEQIYDAISYGSEIYECFDDFMVGIMTGGKPPFKMMGFDTYEEDYFHLLSSYEESAGMEESKKRLMRMSKEEIIMMAGKCFALAFSYLNIKYKYDCLKSAFDIISEKNGSLIRNAKDIEAAYDEWESSGREYSKGVALDKLVSLLPDRAWIE